MATYYRDKGGCEIEQSGATAAQLTIYFEVGTHEAQTVTVSKAGAGFGATAVTVASQVDGTLYKLVIHADDVDTLGEVAFKCAGATDTQYIMGLRVVTHNPFTATANIVQYEVNVVGDIPTPEKVRDAIASSLKGRSASDVVDAFVDSMKTKYDEANNQLMLKDQELQKKIDDPKATAKERESLEARLASLRESINEMGARRERTIRLLKNG